MIPSVVSECNKLFEDWKIGDITSYSKYSFKKLMKDIFYEKNRNDILNLMKGYKKISYEKCSQEKHEMKEYFKTLSIESCRIRFRIDCNLVPTVRSHYKSKYKSQGLECIDCRATNSDPSSVKVDTIDHLSTSCVANDDLRQGRRMDVDADLTDFFQQLIQRRIQRYRDCQIPS